MKSSKGLGEVSAIKAFVAENPAWAGHHLIAMSRESGEDTYWEVKSSRDKAVGQVYKDENRKMVVETYPAPYR